MAVKAHLDALNSRHENLEAILSNELKCASRDEIRISELKREKLRLKDEMTRLRRRKS